jgi:HEAT repeat protein
LGADAKAAIPAATKLLETGDFDDQVNAARILYNMGPTGIAPLAEVLANSKAAGRSMAASFLDHYADPAIPLSKDKIKSRDEIDRDAEVIVPILMGHLRGQDREARMWAMGGLGYFAKKPEIVVPALIPFLTDADNQIRGVAAQALEMFGTNAIQAVPALEEALKDDDPVVQNAAKDALKAIKSQP